MADSNIHRQLLIASGSDGDDTRVRALLGGRGRPQHTRHFWRHCSDGGCWVGQKHEDEVEKGGNKTEEKEFSTPDGAGDKLEEVITTHC